MVWPAASCKKEKTQDPQKTKIDLITNRPWKIVFRGYDFNKDGVYKEDDYMENFLAECQLDDDFIFAANGTYTVHPNTNTNGCGTGSYTSTWQLSSNGTDFSFDVMAGKLMVLNDNNFQFKLMEADGSENVLIFRR
jgi:hypothetical protein